MKRLIELANELQPIERKIQDRICSSVRVASGSLRLALMTALTFIMRWPDWQLTSLFTRGFKVSGLIEPSNVYPRVAPAAVDSLHAILDPEDADKWNSTVASGSFPSDLDKEVYDTAQEQVKNGLLSKSMSKKDIDKIFGKGSWRAIRRRGLQQGDKVRGIDNARASRTNFAAFLQDTIMTTPHDIAIQILAWLFSGKKGSKRFRGLRNLKLGLGADDLADAYHGIPNSEAQLGLCVVAIMNPDSKKIEFHISYAHLFGLSAAVVNFNRLPELLTAASRRIGMATTWHFFDDQGVIDFEDATAPPPAPLAGGAKRIHTSVVTLPDASKGEYLVKADIPERMSAQCFTSSLFHLVGRPFKEKKHLPPEDKQGHLGLLNDLSQFMSGYLSLRPKEGKMEELHKLLLDLRVRRPRLCTLSEIMKITGILIFLLMACFDKLARGGLRPFFDWIADNSDSTSLWRTKLNPIKISASLMVGVEFFLFTIPLIKPRIYSLGIVQPLPVVAYSDAEWTVREPPLLPRRGLGGCIFIDNKYKACSINTPADILFSLAPRDTQIIPLELLAATGLLYTFRKDIENKDLLMFIDNQSVCGALVKGASRSRDIQQLTSAFHAMCAKLRVRVWVEWVPSESNPADILSREHCSEQEILAGYEEHQVESKPMELPEWSHQQNCDDIGKILKAVSEL